MLTEKIFNFIDQTIKNKKKLLIWQYQEDLNQRFSSQIQILERNVDGNYLIIKFLDDHFKFFKMTKLYFYSQTDSLIFKCLPSEAFKLNSKISFPLDFKFLDERQDKFIIKSVTQIYQDELIKVSGGVNISQDDPFRVTNRSSYDRDLFEGQLDKLTLDEEDRLFKDKRQSPRAKPGRDKKVILAKTLDVLDKTYQLYDLSRGGLSFFVPTDFEVKVGDLLLIKGFDLKRFDKPLVGEVMSVRLVEDLGERKVGVKFIE